jgi:predicted nucleic acid-binding Zn finger protein
MLIRSEIKRAKSKPFKYPAGPFENLQPESLLYMTSVMYDKEDDIEYNVKYICSCDEYVYSLGVEGSFGCIHCDSVCKYKNCEVCQYLNEKDLWSDANL